MEYEKIKQLMEDMSNSCLSRLEIEFPEGLKICMNKEESNTSVNIINSKDTQDNLELQIKQDNNKYERNDKKRNVVKSPMVGTFYLKPSPTSEPYVEIGKNIKQGETLCIIEAMKLMNEIESEYSGTIKEILAKDGQVVEFGTELFVVE